MKKLLFSFLAILFATTAMAQIPDGYKSAATITLDDNLNKKRNNYTLLLNCETVGDVDFYIRWEDEAKTIESRTIKSTGGVSGLIVSLTVKNTKFELFTEKPEEVIHLTANNLTELDVSALTGLKRLNCSGTDGSNHASLKTLNLSLNTSLTELYCYRNQLTGLNLEKNIKLETLSCYNNQLTQLNVSNCTSLISLHCSNNQLPELNVSNCTSLTSLYCYTNQLTFKDLMTVNNLNSLKAYSSQAKVKIDESYTAITPINLSHVEAESYTWFYADGIAVPTDDYSVENGVTTFNKEVGEVYCEMEHKSDFPLLTLKTTNTTIDYGRFAATITLDDNLNKKGNNYTLLLNCETVGDVDFFIKWADGTAEKHTIKSNNGEDANQKVDLTLESLSFELFTEKPEEVIHLTANNLTELNVSKLTGLKRLYCNGPDWSNHAALETLDLSQNTSLTFLYCNHNQLLELNVSNCTSLTSLYCSDNQLTQLNVLNCTSLEYLHCRTNQLIGLNLENNRGLWNINCSENQLTELNLENNTELTELHCHTNQLTQLNIKNCTSLERIECHTNQLTELNLENNTELTELNLENNTELTELHCHTNQLTQLNIKNCTSLERIECHTNQLTELNLENNTELTELRCHTNQLTGLNIESCTSLEYLGCHTNQLAQLNVEKNIELKTLSCYTNQLTGLDLSKSTTLKVLVCYDNKLKKLDLENNINLVSLYCNDNQLTFKDLKTTEGYTIKNFEYWPQSDVKIDAVYGVATKIDLSHTQATDYKWFYASGTAVSIDDYSVENGVTIFNKEVGEVYCKMIHKLGFPLLTLKTTQTIIDNVRSAAKIKLDSRHYIKDNEYTLKLDCKTVGNVDFYIRWEDGTTEKHSIRSNNNTGSGKDTELTLKSQSFELFTENPEEVIHLTALNLATLDVSALTGLKFLYCYGTDVKNPASLNTLDLSKNTSLTSLFCSKNQLTQLDLAKNIKLEFLYCDNNQLTQLNLEENIKLEYLSCDNNQLTQLNVLNCTSLTRLSCSNNQLTQLNLEENIKLESLSCYNNQLTELNVSNCTSLTTLYCSKNQLTFKDLMTVNDFKSLKNYSPQSDVQIDVVYGVATKIDLSHTQAETYKWYYANGTAVSTDDYSVENGVTTFNKPVGEVYCEMKHTSDFPLLTLKTTNTTISGVVSINESEASVSIVGATRAVIVTTSLNQAKCAIYNTSGSLVVSETLEAGENIIALPHEGVYIVKIDNITQKVIVK